MQYIYISIALSVTLNYPRTALPNITLIHKIKQQNTV